MFITNNEENTLNDGLKIYDNLPTGLSSTNERLSL
jgi:hypothetical protein